MFLSGSTTGEEMQIALDAVHSTENSLEGTLEDGTTVTLTGTFIYEGYYSRFTDAKMVTGPTYLKDQPCEVIIEDTTAQLTIYSTSPQGLLGAMLAA